MEVAPLLGLILAASAENDELAGRVAGATRYGLTVGGVPLVRHAVAATRAAGAERILVVVDAATRRDVGHTLGPDVELLELAIGAGHGAALAAAAVRHDGPVLVHAGDGFAGPSLGLTAESYIAAGGRGVVVLAGGDGPPPATLLSAAAFADAGPAGNGDLAGLAARLRMGGHDVEVRAAPGAWRYGNAEENLLEGNRLVLDELPLQDDGAVPSRLIDSRADGRVSIHPSAHVERTTIRGPAHVGPRAVLVDSFVGPYTSIGERVHLEGAEVEYSVVLDGASIRNVDRRIEASVIGRNAKIARRFAMPSALRLRVGEGAEVHLT